MKYLAAIPLILALGGAPAFAQQATAPIPPPSAATPSTAAAVPPPVTAPVPPAASARPVASRATPAHRRHHVAQRQSPASERRETQALNILEASGDRDFSDVHRQGRGYSATVNQNGAAQTVVVDPRSGNIRNTQ